jgi:hypothetical protein
MRFSLFLVIFFLFNFIFCTIAFFKRGGMLKSDMYIDYREANRVANALATLNCQQDAFTLFDAPPLGVDRLYSFDSLGVATPCINFAYFFLGLVLINEKKKHTLVN